MRSNNKQTVWTRTSPRKLACAMSAPRSSSACTSARLSASPHAAAKCSAVSPSRLTTAQSIAAALLAAPRNSNAHLAQLRTAKCSGVSPRQSRALSGSPLAAQWSTKGIDGMPKCLAFPHGAARAKCSGVRPLTLSAKLYCGDPTHNASTVMACTCEAGESASKWHAVTPDKWSPTHALTPAPSNVTTRGTTSTSTVKDSLETGECKKYGG